MNTSRQAILFSSLYALPLTAWLMAQLTLIEWTTGNAGLIFDQTLAVLILLQLATIGLLFINRAVDRWQHDLSAVFQIVLFPLPFYALIWLAGSASLPVLLKCVITVFAVGVLILLIRLTSRACMKSRKPQEIITSSAILALAALVWNFHAVYWSWVNL